MTPSELLGVFFLVVFSFFLLTGLKLFPRAEDISVDLMGLGSRSSIGCRGIVGEANYLRRRREDQTWPVRNQPAREETSDGALLKEHTKRRDH